MSIILYSGRLRPTDVVYLATFLCIPLVSSAPTTTTWKREDVINLNAKPGSSVVELDIDGADKLPALDLEKLGFLVVNSEDGNKFEGDIANNFTQDSIHEWVEDNNDVRRNAIKDAYNLWDNPNTNNGPTRRIPYMIDNSFGVAAQNAIAKAMGVYHRETCIRFKPRDKVRDRDYINIQRIKDEGCYSFVGRMGRQQEVNLDTGCLEHGTILHELMHAVGFFHEHSRNDRDDWINIFWGNISPGGSNQFEKYSLNTITHLGVEYDYGSIMHYRPYAFSSNGQKTISPKKATHPDANKMGQRIRFSPKDLQKINKLYRCPQKVVPGAVKSQRTSTTTTPRPTLKVVKLPNVVIPSTGSCTDQTWRCVFWSWGFFDYCKKYDKIKHEVCRKSCKQCR